MHMPKVSVLMLIYKPQEDYLRAAIESILNQTFSDFELLLLDDCPEDTRETIVGSYDDSRIRYAKNKTNLGITQSRNKLIDMARGEYLAVCDYDDVSLPERFVKEVAYLDEHPDCGVVSGWVRVMGSDVVAMHPETDDEIRYEMMSEFVISHPASMIRKSVLQEHGIRYEGYYSPAEDCALFCRLLSVTSFYNVQAVILDYRQHDMRTSVVQAKRLRDGILRVKALNQVINPILCIEDKMRRPREMVFKIFGIRVLTFEIVEHVTFIRLFGLRIAKIVIYD